jgi:hypothetical protein
VARSAADDQHRSSDYGTRSFCGRCGSPLFCASTLHPDRIDITLASTACSSRQRSQSLLEPDRDLCRLELPELWDGRFVGDDALTAAIYAARRALGDSAGTATYIRTLRGRGYQFQFRPVHAVAGRDDASAASRRDAYLAWPGGPTDLHVGENGIGRDPSSVVVLDRLNVSRHHARIVISEEGALLEDLGSKNGTRLNRRRIAVPATLAEGDLIEIGGVAMIFRCGSGGLSTLTQESGYSS